MDCNINAGCWILIKNCLPQTIVRDVFVISSSPKASIIFVKSDSACLIAKFYHQHSI